MNIIAFENIIHDLDPENVGIEDLVLEFFVTFASIEYAMKSFDDFRIIKADGKIEADWNRFGAHVEPFLRQGDGDIQAAVNRLVNDPPRQFVLRNSSPSERPLPNPELFDSIRVIRNNLFHGSKLHSQSRNSQLMKDTLLILNFCVTNNQQLHLFYSERNWLLR